MPPIARAAAAYQASSTHRGLRAQEADVFRRMIGALRAGRDADPMTRVRALADNRRLWTAVDNLVRDPENALPAALRASIASIGLTVQREMDRDNPDLDFLITINENFASGLSGTP